MPKQTRKYTQAVDLAKQIGASADGNQDVLYATLAFRGYTWLSDEGQWVQSPDPDPATELVMLRVWAKKELVDSLADQVANAMQSNGLKLVERSDLYLCRPPKQLEGRIYLKFIPKGG